MIKKKENVTRILIRGKKYELSITHNPDQKLILVDFDEGIILCMSRDK